MIAQMPDDRLDDQSGDRPRDPQQGQFGDVGAERLEDAARIGILQPPDDLDAEQRKAHAPQTKAVRRARALRSEEHTSELQSLMRISYAVFCLKKKKKQTRLKSIIIPAHTI